MLYFLSSYRHCDIRQDGSNLLQIRQGEQSTDRRTPYGVRDDDAFIFCPSIVTARNEVTRQSRGRIIQKQNKLIKLGEQSTDRRAPYGVRDDDERERGEQSTDRRTFFLS